MKYLLLILSFCFLLLSSLTQANAACDSTQTTVVTGDSFSVTSGCYTSATSGKTYAVPTNTSSSSNASSNAASAPTVNTSDTTSIVGISDADLRTGNVDMDTIPQVIVSVIQFLLAIAGTVAIVALIYHAVQMQINSGITGDSSHVENAKKGMIGALMGFVLAILSWFLVTRFAEILTAMS